MSRRVEHIELLNTLRNFVQQECIPAETIYESQIVSGARFSKQPPVMEKLKLRAQQLGLFNLWAYPQYSDQLQKLLHDIENSPKKKKQFKPCTLLEYAECCEIMGYSPKIAPEACNCNAPDTGNAEVLLKYASNEQQLRFLVPLLEGRTRSSFGMTEPEVASSDATNISCEIKSANEGYIVNGKKWWISNAGHPHLDFILLLGRHPESEIPLTKSSKHKRHSIVIIPAKTAGVNIIRPMTVFGYDDAVEGHMEIEFSSVKLPKSSLVLREGSGFEMMQGRLGPGRVHHCMRAIGSAERVMSMLCERAKTRIAFGQPLSEYGDIQQLIAHHRLEISKNRLLIQQCATQIDFGGPKKAMLYIAMIKASVPVMLCKLVDDAIQIFGGMGLCQDCALAGIYAGARSLRIADGPDAVHLMQIFRYEMKSSGSQAKSML